MNSFVNLFNKILIFTISMNNKKKVSFSKKKCLIPRFTVDRQIPSLTQLNELNYFIEFGFRVTSVVDLLLSNTKKKSSCFWREVNSLYNNSPGSLFHDTNQNDVLRPRSSTKCAWYQTRIFSQQFHVKAKF